MIIAIPTEGPGGLNGSRSDHFGHCDVFTVVELVGNDVIGVKIVDNVPHGEGGCLGPVTMLKDANVDAIVVAGMGTRPMQGFVEAGIVVYYADKQTVTDVNSAVGKLTQGGLPVMHSTQLCNGAGNCNH